jgi:hypothetical protein
MVAWDLGSQPERYNDHDQPVEYEAGRRMGILYIATALALLFWLLMAWLIAGLIMQWVEGWR